MKLYHSPTHSGLFPACGETQAANPKEKSKQTPKVFTSDDFQVLLEFLLGDARPEKRFLFFMRKEPGSNSLTLFTFTKFFLMSEITLPLVSTRHPVTRRHSSGVAGVSQIKLNPSTETFPKSETVFFSCSPSLFLFLPQNAQLLWF